MASYNKRISDQSKVKFNPINRELEDSENSELDSRVDNLEENILGSKTATGNPITVTDALPVNVLNLSMDLEPIQAGSGTPSPDNIRPISGRSEVAINRVSGEVTDTYTIQLGDTVYGGTLDVTRGKMVVDKGYATVDEDSEILIGSGGSMFVATNALRGAKSPISQSQLTGVLCNSLREVTQASTWGIQGTFSRSRQTITSIYFKITNDITTIEQVKSYLTSNPLQFVYELATPITIPLTPQQIKMLENTNTLYTDYEGDTIHIEYQLNNTIGKVLGEIDDIYNKIGSLDTRVTALEKS